MLVREYDKKKNKLRPFGGSRQDKQRDQLVAGEMGMRGNEDMPDFGLADKKKKGGLGLFKKKKDKDKKEKGEKKKKEKKHKSGNKESMPVEGY